MIKSYFKIALRSIAKRKGFAFINYAGLTLGLASVMTLGLLIYKYYTTDDIQANKSRMYYLKSFGTDDKNGFAMTTFPLLNEIKKSCPEVEAGTHLQWGNVPWLKYGDKQVQEDTRYVEPDFFKVFSFPLTEGDPTSAFKDKFSVVISQSVKQKLFGDRPALGKIILADDSIPVTVRGVLAQIPSNSSIKVEVLFLTDYLKATDKANFETMYNWYNVLAEGYLVLKNGTDINNLDRKINVIVQKFYASDHKNLKVKVSPFAKIKQEGNTNIKTIVAGSIAASVFILLIITFNLLNLNAASMVNRTKEVAIRQIIGSAKTQIIFQFAVENGIIILGSLFTAYLLFIYLLLPQINLLLGENLGVMVLNFKSDYLIIGGFVVVAFCIIAIGVYPVLHIITAKTTDAIKGNIVNTGDRAAVRKILLTAQFTLAIILICSAIILNKQIGFMKVMPLGYQQDNVAIVNLDLAFKDLKSAKAQFKVILSSLKNNPYVEAVSGEHNIPTAYDQNHNEFSDISSEKKIGMRQSSAGEGFLEVYNIPLTSGRNFSDQLAKSEETKVVLNETAVKAYGWKKPIGKQIRSSGGNQVYTVIGVMKDFHYDDMQHSIGPLVHFYNSPNNLESFNSLVIRINEKHTKEVLSQLENEFKHISTRREFSYKFMANMVDKQYTFIAGILKVTNYVALLTIAIACMGMLGLITLLAKQRVKEIGVRKVLGASVVNITTLICKDFIKVIFVAIIIASPIAWFLMKKWLQDFAYQIEITWWMFALSGALTLIIALFVVSFQAIKAAIANPVKSLRAE